MKEGAKRRDSSAVGAGRPHGKKLASPEDSKTPDSHHLFLVKYSKFINFPEKPYIFYILFRPQNRYLGLGPSDQCHLLGQDTLYWADTSNPYGPGWALRGNLVNSTVSAGSRRRSKQAAETRLLAIGSTGDSMTSL